MKPLFTILLLSVLTAIGQTNRPPTPANFTMQPAGEYVSLSWQAVTDLDIVGYAVLVGPGAGIYTNTFTIIGAATTNWTWANAAPGTYFAAVKALRVGGEQSDFSNVVHFRVPEVPNKMHISAVLEHANPPGLPEQWNEVAQRQPVVVPPHMRGEFRAVLRYKLVREPERLP